ncbi:hypothetical protein [Pseudorhizobium flavum]|uniref:Cytochrome c oxidase assembly factor 3 mitochondrial coiled-coil domain-containing protein n=1 Tax=Pseudorhizobium flavum TaxID=1335061 RepID=A0A7W9Z175_9HYPH|nr:hypothetical protein [Pseudorhizobium flavum]MBB6182172.1 hypothetical protein [Pseudorhizobium flavum]
MANDQQQRQRRIRRNNRIVLAILVAFVLGVFTNSFFHIGDEARPGPATSPSQMRP